MIDDEARPPGWLPLLAVVTGTLTWCHALFVH
jgi:hypothetical protein